MVTCAFWPCPSVTSPGATGPDVVHGESSEIERTSTGRGPPLCGITDIAPVGVDRAVAAPPPSARSPGVGRPDPPAAAARCPGGAGEVERTPPGRGPSLCGLPDLAPVWVDRAVTAPSASARSRGETSPAHQTTPDTTAVPHMANANRRTAPPGGTKG